MLYRIDKSIHRATALGLLAGLALSFAMLISRASEFAPPDLAGFSLHSERDADRDGDGSNETHIRLYLDPSGNSVFSMTTNGRLWAWSLETRDGKGGAAKNYVMRDSDCDGIFDEVYGLDEDFHVPECVK